MRAQGERGRQAIGGQSPPGEGENGEAEEAFGKAVKRAWFVLTHRVCGSFGRLSGPQKQGALSAPKVALQARVQVRWPQAARGK